MTRGGVNASGPRFARSFLLRERDIDLGFGVRFTAERHVFAQHQQRGPIDPRVPRLQSIERRTWKA